MLSGSLASPAPSSALTACEMLSGSLASPAPSSVLTACDMLGGSLALPPPPSALTTTRPLLTKGSWQALTCPLQRAPSCCKRGAASATVTPPGLTQACKRGVVVQAGAGGEAGVGCAACCCAFMPASQAGGAGGVSSQPGGEVAAVRPAASGLPSAHSSDGEARCASARLVPGPRASTGLDPGPRATIGLDPGPGASTGLDPKPRTCTGLDPKPRTSTGLDPKPRITIGLSRTCSCEAVASAAAVVSPLAVAPPLAGRLKRMLRPRLTLPGVTLRCRPPLQPATAPPTPWQVLGVSPAAPPAAPPGSPGLAAAGGHSGVPGAVPPVSGGHRVGGSGLLGCPGWWALGGAWCGATCEWWAQGGRHRQQV